MIASAVACGARHTCAIRAVDSELFCFGEGSSGQLGIGVSGTRDIGNDEPIGTADPVDLRLPGETAAVVADAVVAAEEVSCARRASDQQLVCFGDATAGTLGTGTSTSSGDTETAGSGGAVPIGAVGAFAAGGWHACAVRTADGLLYCWGDNSAGQLGLGTNTTVGLDVLPLAAGAVPLPAGLAITDVCAGKLHTCAIAGGRLFCWGHGASGATGLGVPVAFGDDAGEDVGVGGEVLLGGFTASQVSCGTFHTCVLLSTGTAVCFGASPDGRTTHGETIGDDEAAYPAGEVTSLPGAVSGIATGDTHTCFVLQSDGSVYCSGRGADGQLGPSYTTTSCRVTGTDYEIVTTTASVTDIGDTCSATLSDGSTTYGIRTLLAQVTVDSDANYVPVGPMPLGGRAADAACAGEKHTCIHRLTDNDLVCTGDNDSGQLGLGSIAAVGISSLPATAGVIVGLASPSPVPDTSSPSPSPTASPSPSVSPSVLALASLPPRGSPIPQVAAEPLPTWATIVVVLVILVIVAGIGYAGRQWWHRRKSRKRVAMYSK